MPVTTSTTLGKKSSAPAPVLPLAKLDLADYRSDGESMVISDEDKSAAPAAATTELSASKTSEDDAEGEDDVGSNSGKPAVQGDHGDRGDQDDQQDQAVEGLSLLKLRDQGLSSDIVRDNIFNTTKIKLTNIYEQWCCSCGNGGTVYSCSFCPRVVCTDKCIELKAPTELLTSDHCHFICPACQRKYDREANNKVPTPYTVSVIIT